MDRGGSNWHEGIARPGIAELDFGCHPVDNGNQDIKEVCLLIQSFEPFGRGKRRITMRWTQVAFVVGFNV